jgi:hypothetical protein
MNVRWGGKSTAKRDTIIEENCLGENVPVIGGVQLAVGMVQRMVFEAGSPPPFQSPEWSPDDREMTVEEKIHKLKAIEKAKNIKRLAAERNGLCVDANEEDVQQSFIVPGYIGANKGIYQILYERGLYLPGMKGKMDQSVKDKLVIKGDLDKILSPELDAHAVLANCDDFKYERNALQLLIEQDGDILLPSVVCTPETAGNGIEYAWGKLKFEQRKENSGAAKLESGVKFNERVRKLVTNVEILPMLRCWKFARRARDYIRMYLDMQGSSSQPTYSELENMKKKMKTHRNIMEVDRVYVMSA